MKYEAPFAATRSAGVAPGMIGKMGYSVTVAVGLPTESTKVVTRDVTGTMVVLVAVGEFRSLTRIMVDIVVMR